VPAAAAPTTTERRPAGRPFLRQATTTKTALTHAPSLT